ncbi:hypothetical protein [Pedobacter aquatilis]|uniref:hypothetical protein n=1 Tax=Pedobacter aquatilis TaxID=351343 RepID=UPI00292CF3B0|nr:hypothetical protein [Pedobacter aquatilis]
MATSDGIVRFSGKLGDLIFYVRGKKRVVRKKPITHQLSAASKSASTDFGEASKQAAYIRNAFSPLLKIYSYGDVTSRFTQRLCKIFKTIPDKHRGNKKLIDGDVKLLCGLEFNAVTPLANLLYQLPFIKISAKGLLHLQLNRMKMTQFVKVVAKSDAFVLRLMVFALGLADDQIEIIAIEDYQVDLNLPDFDGATLDIPFEAAGEKALMIALGVSYLKDGIPSGNRKYFAGGITHCWHLRDGVEVVFKPELPVKEDEVVEQIVRLKWKPSQD